MLNSIIKEELQTRSEEDIKGTIKDVIKSLQFIIENPYTLKVDRLETAKTDIDGILNYYLEVGGGPTDKKFFDIDKVMGR